MPLLAYVALSQSEVNRQDLVDALWADGKLVNLRQELSKIRRLPGADEWFRADAASAIQVLGKSDVAHLRALFSREEYGLVTELWTGRRGMYLLSGLNLDSLPAPYHDWLGEASREVEEVFAESFRQLALQLEAQGDLAAALQAYRALTTIDPMAESAHRAIIRLEVAAGQPDAAAHQLDFVRSVFMREMETLPSEETLALADVIRRARITAGAEVTAPGSGRQLPVPRTPFIGREAELAELARLAGEPESRIVTVSGMGGVGKSRLAIEYASRHSDDFPDGVVYVALANTERADLVPASLAAKLGLPVEGETLKASLLEHLARHSYLLLFDNVEQLPEVAELLDQVVQVSPGSKVMVTSQVHFGLQLERVFYLTGMRHPAEGEDADLEAFDAVRLFTEVVPNRPAAGELTHIGRICRLLDGLPLGIELAAGLTDQLSCREIAQELLNGNFDVLSISAMDRPERHRAVRLLLEATWKLLGCESQQHVAKLSVFQGPFHRDDAGMVAGVGFHGLRRLVHWSLLSVDQDGLLTMHSVVKWFAEERLLAMRGGRALKRRLHAQAAVRIRARLEGESPRSPEELAPWLGVYRHLLLAEKFDDACRLLVSFDVRKLLSWGRASMVLELHEELFPNLTDDALKGRSLNSMALSLSRLGRLAEAIEVYESALSCARRGNDLINEANYLGNLGIALSISGQLTEAITLHERAVQISQGLGDRRSEGIDLGCIGLAYNRLGEVDTAIGYHERALVASRDAGDGLSEANHLGNLARIYATRQSLVHALAYAQAALNQRRLLGDRRGEAMDLHCLAEIAEGQSKPEEAESLYLDSLKLSRQIGAHIGECETLFALAKLVHSAERTDEAISYVQAALAVNSNVGDGHMQGELLAWLGDHFAETGDDKRAALLWIKAHEVLPDKDSLLTKRIRASIGELDLLQDTGSITWLLKEGANVLAQVTRIPSYSLSHMELLSVSAAA